MEKVWLDQLVGKTIEGYERIPEFSGDESNHEVIFHFTDGTSVLIKAWAEYAEDSGLDVEFIDMTAIQYIEHLSKEAKLKNERAINAEILRIQLGKDKREKAQKMNKLIADMVAEDEE